jgi:hypothetical protein
MWNDDLALCCACTSAHALHVWLTSVLLLSRLLPHTCTRLRVCALLYAPTLLAGFPFVHNCIDRNLGVAIVTEIYQYVILLDPFFSSKLMDSTSDREFLMAFEKVPFENTLETILADLLEARYTP